MFDKALFDRLFSRVIIDEYTGCHVWQGQTDGKSDDPYGRCSYKGATLGVHVAMWKAHKGRIRKGYEIDHRCTTRLCINIDHLQEVTQLKNARLREKRKRHKGDVFKCLAVR